MRYSLLWFLLVLVGPLTAQTDSPAVKVRDTTAYRCLQFGIGGGHLLHEVNFTPNSPLQEKLPRNNYALLLRYFDNPLVGFQAEVGLMQAGWREAVFERDYKYERRVDYLEVLVLTQLSPGRGAVQPLLQAGPYVSFPLREEEDVNPEIADPENTYYGRALPFRVNFGVQVGAGLNVELGPVTVQLEGRYLLGFNDLIRTGEAGVSESRRQAIGGHVGLLLSPFGR